MKIKAFVLSDLHYPRTKMARDVGRPPEISGLDEINKVYNVFSGFKTYLQNFAETTRKEYADVIIIVTGDLTDKCEISGLIDGVRFLEECSEILEIPQKNIIVAPGNHDLLKDKDEKRQKMEYEKATSLLTTAFDDTCYYYHKDKLLVYSFNSITYNEFVTGKFFRKRNLEELPLISEPQIEKYRLTCKKHNSIIKIAILHSHILPVYGIDIRPYDVVSNAGKLIRTLQDLNTSFIFHGHKHVQSEKIVQDLESSNPLPQIIIGFRDFSQNGDFAELDFNYDDGKKLQALYSRYRIENGLRQQVGSTRDIWQYVGNYKNDVPNLVSGFAVKVD